MTARPISQVDLQHVLLPGGWRRVPMASAAGESCSILEATHPAATLRLPLPRSGSVRLSVGLVVRSGQRRTAMQFRIAPGGHWRRVRPMRLLQIDRDGLQDGDLGVLDLPVASQLEIRTEPGCTAALAYVRTTPDVSAAPHRHRQNAGVVFDTAMTMSTYRIEAPDDLLAVLRPYADSDVSDIFWGTTVGTYSPLYFSEALGYHGREKRAQWAEHRETAAVRLWYLYW